MSVEPPNPVSAAVPETAKVEEAPKDKAAESATAKPKTRSFWRALPIIVVVLVLLLAAGVAALVYAPPTEFLKAELIRYVNNATGRELTINGPAKFKIYPKLAVELGNVSLSGPPGAVGAELLRAEAINTEIRPFSLLKGPVEITRVEVVKPALTLRPEDKTLFQAKDAAGSGARATSGSSIVLKELAITEGSASYFIQQPNPQWRVNELTAVFTGVSGQGEAKGSGSFRWHDEPVKFSGLLSDASALGRGAATPMTMMFEATHATVALKGEATGEGDGAIKGTLDAKSKSFRELLRWVDIDLGPNALSGAASIEGAVTATPKSIRLERNQVKLAAGDGTIDAQVLLEGNRPQVTGTMAWRQLDLEKLVGEPPKLPALALQVRATQPGPTLAPAWDALSAELAQLETSGQSLATAAAASPAKDSPGGWSKRAINFSALNSVDLNFTAGADTVKYGGLEMQRSSTEVTLHDGRLSYTVKQLEIDKGKVTGRLDVDATVKPAKVALSVSASDVAAERVMQAFVDQQVLTGTTKLDVVVSGRGANEQELVSSLEGTVKMGVTKGEVVGFNIRQALLEWWKSWTFDPKRKTKFDSISASYGIRNGIMRNTSDLALMGDEINIKSSGSVALTSRTVDQRITLQAVPPPIHFPVPIRVDGAWSNVSIGWDWLGMLKDPQGLGVPMSVAPSPEGPPPELKAAIERLLSGPTAGQLPEESRALLKSLAGG